MSQNKLYSNTHESDTYLVVSPLHLISVLWEDPSPEASTSANANPQPTLLKGAVEHSGGNTTLFNRALMQRLTRLPVVEPAPSPPLPLSQTFHQVIREAQKQQKQQNDQFVAIDHIILALLKGAELPEICKTGSVDVKALEAELRRKRGGRKVDSRGAEAQFEALAKCE